MSENSGNNTNSFRQKSKTPKNVTFPSQYIHTVHILSGITHFGFLSSKNQKVVLIFTIAVFSQPTYGDYKYPWWAIVIGWCLALCSLVPIPICMLLSISNSKGTLLQRIQKQSRPASNWGPALDINRKILRYKAPESTIPLQSHELQI